MRQYKQNIFFAHKYTMETFGLLPSPLPFCAIVLPSASFFLLLLLLIMQIVFWQFLNYKILRYVLNSAHINSFVSSSVHCFSPRWLFPICPEWVTFQLFFFSVLFFCCCFNILSFCCFCSELTLLFGTFVLSHRFFLFHHHLSAFAVRRSLFVFFSFLFRAILHLLFSSYRCLLRFLL